MLALLAFLGSSALGDVDRDFEQLKSSIQSRSERIQQLKALRELRETSSGLLEADLTASSEAKNLSELENSDRRSLFELVARMTATALEEVASRFATMATKATGLSSPGGSYSPSGREGSTERPDEPFRPVQHGSRLPLKVLTRPQAALYAESSPSATGRPSAYPAFTVLQVVDQSEGWYRVAEREGGPPAGWFKADDVIEWKHHLIAAFTHPDGRNRALIFRTKEPLMDLASLPRAERQSRIDADIRPRGGAPDAALVGVEPEGWARMEHEFYMLPITDYEDIDIDGRTARLLKVSAATQSRKGQSSPNETGNSPRQPVRADVVFVMDLTRSMGPFVGATMAMLREIAGSFKADDLPPDAIRFGFWGYRDDPTVCKGIEFLTRNYTSELQSLDSFLRTLATVEETKVDSVDFAEDVYAGLADAITETRWRENSIRLICLVGDAPGRGPRETEPECSARPRPEGTECGMNADGLRALADSRSVYISAIYLESPKWRQFTDRGMAQFKTLASNPASAGGTESVTVLDASDSGAYADCAKSFAVGLRDNLTARTSRELLPEAGAIPSGMTDPTSAGRQMANNVFRGAFIEWASAREDVEELADVSGWTIDKDPADPARTILEPGVLLNRDQLDSLRRMVDDIVNAGIRAQLSSEDFFTSLQAVVAVGARDPDRLRAATDLKTSGMIPDFLDGLPYRSRILDFSRETWQVMSGDEQDQFIRDVESKLQFYLRIYENTALWQRLNPNDDDREAVANVPLAMLP